MSPIPAPTVATAEAGFTLIELMVTLAIVAVVVGLAMPRFGASMSHASLHSTVQQIAAELRATRSAAMASNDEKTLLIDVDAHSYRSDVNTDLRLIPAGVRIEVSGSGVASLGQTTKLLRFLPDGSGGPGTLRFVDDGRSATLTVDWLTGSTHVVWSK